MTSINPFFSPQREFNASQLAHQDAFREAIAYAMTAFNAAMADWFNKPQELEIDTND